MEHVKYTNDSQSYSRLIAGCMRWGIWGAKYSTTQYQSIINACLENGVTTFDHADIYGDYTTENEFGVAMSSLGVARENYQLISKCGIRMLSENRPLNKLKSYDLSKDYIIASVDTSLKNLKTEYLDLLLLHRPSPLMNVAEVSEAFAVLRESGKVRDFGVSNFSAAQFDLLNEEFSLVTNQLEISPIQLSSFMDGTLDKLQMKGIKPQAWSPLGGAELFMKQTKIEETERVMRLQSVCGDYDWSIPQMALLFLLQHPAKISPVLGTSKPERIKEAVLTLQMKISDEQWFEIWTASTGVKVP